VDERVMDLSEEEPAANRLIVLPQRFYTPTQVSITTAERTERLREQMRGWIALVLTAALLTLVLFTLLYVILSGLPTDELVRVIQGVGATILTPIVGLIGAVTGFYYGGQTAAQTVAAQSAGRTLAGETPNGGGAGSPRG
jgi:hypothetical protein